MSATPFLLPAAVISAIAALTITLTPVALRRFRLVVFAAAALAPLPVLADVAGASTVDFSGLVNATVTLIGGVALWLLRGVAAAVIGYIGQKTRLELDDHTRAYLDHALERAVAYAEAQAERLIGPGASSVDVHDAVVAKAVNYAIDRVPDALAHFGITADALTRMIQARVSTMFGPPELDGAEATGTAAPAG